MSEQTDTLAALDQLIAEAEKRHIEQVACLRYLIARGQSISEAMRTLVKIEDDLVALNEQWRALLPSDPE